MARQQGTPASRPYSHSTNDHEGIDAIEDAKLRYAKQCDIVDRLRKEWEEMGSPMTTKGGSTGKQVIVHPLVREIQDAETLADRFLQRVVEKRPIGRPPGSGSSPDRQNTDKATPRIRKVA